MRLPPPFYRRSIAGFTLAELLIALVILGVIATFTIPKVLQSQQDTKWKSMAKEVASIISGAYSAYQLQNSASSQVKPMDFTPFINYVQLDNTTSSKIDHVPGQLALDCTAGQPCLLLHNGGSLRLTNQTFGGTAGTNAIRIYFDPDSKYSGSANGEGKSVLFFLYYSGRLRTKASIEPNTCDESTCRNPDLTEDPAWFSWN